MTKQASPLRSTLLSRATLDQHFMASAIATWQYANPDVKVHEFLRCKQEDIWRINLAKRPQNGPEFTDAVKQLAHTFSVDANALASLARLANSLDSLREVADNEERPLMAARDHFQHDKD